MDESTKATIEKYQAKMELLEAQIRKIKTSINGLCELENEQPMYDVEGETPNSASRTLPIRPDQFFGRPLATVVREILTARAQRNQGAIPLEDLYSTMTSGGFDLEGKDDVAKKRTLAITIGKNPAFIRVPNTGHVGLSDWYPGAKRAKRNDGVEDELPIDKATVEKPLPPNVPEVFSAEGMPETK